MYHCPLFHLQENETTVSKHSGDEISYFERHDFCTLPLSASEYIFLKLNLFPASCTRVDKYVFSCVCRKELETNQLLVKSLSFLKSA
jgi:hypothetical protein